MTSLRVDTWTIPPAFESALSSPGWPDPIMVGAGSFHDALARAQSSSAPPPAPSTAPPAPAAKDRQPSRAADEKKPSDRQSTQESDADQPAREAKSAADTDNPKPSDRADSSVDTAGPDEPKTGEQSDDSAPHRPTEEDKEKVEQPVVAAVPLTAEAPSDPEPDSAAESPPAGGAAVSPSGEKKPEMPAPPQPSPRGAVDSDATAAARRKEEKSEKNGSYEAGGATAKAEPLPEGKESSAEASEGTHEKGPAETPALRKSGRSRENSDHRPSPVDSQKPSPAQSAADGTDESVGAPQSAHDERPSTRQVEPLPPPAAPHTVPDPPEGSGAEKPAVTSDAAAPARGTGHEVSRSAAATPDQGESGGDQADRVRFVQRVARAFESFADRGGSVRLRLHPPELGSLRMEVAIRNGAMTAKLEAETPAAQSLLLDNLPMLRARLAEQHIRVERFDVNLADPFSGGSSGRFDGDAQPRDQHDQQQRPSRGGSEGRLEDVALRRGPARRTSLGQFDVII